MILLFCVFCIIVTYIIFFNKLNVRFSRSFSYYVAFIKIILKFLYSIVFCVCGSVFSMFVYIVFRIVV